MHYFTLRGVCDGRERWEVIWVGSGGEAEERRPGCACAMEERGLARYKLILRVLLGLER